MAESQRIEFRYQPKHCAFFGKVVWAIMTRQPDGSWRIVNCLDKDEACFSLPCAFTTDHGEWPYQAIAAEDARRVSG